MQSLLDGFIKKFVLCVSCDNPETKLIVNQKKSTISLQCTACGYLGLISSQDRLSTYILKCPPDQQNAPGASVSKKKKKEKECKRNGRGSPQPDSDEFNETANDGDNEKDNDDWCCPEEVAEELPTGALKNLTLNADLDKSFRERMQIFYEFANVKIFYFSR